MKGWLVWVGTLQEAWQSQVMGPKAQPVSLRLSRPWIRHRVLGASRPPLRPPTSIGMMWEATARVLPPLIARKPVKWLLPESGGFLWEDSAVSAQSQPADFGASCSDSTWAPISHREGQPCILGRGSWPEAWCRHASCSKRSLFRFCLWPAAPSRQPVLRAHGPPSDMCWAQLEPSGHAHCPP